MPLARLWNQTLPDLLRVAAGSGVTHNPVQYPRRSLIDCRADHIWSVGLFRDPFSTLAWASGGIAIAAWSKEMGQCG